MYGPPTSPAWGFQRGSQAARSGRGSLPSPTQTHLGCQRLRGAGGRGGAPSGTRPPAPWCSLRLQPHGCGRTRLRGRRVRQAERPGARRRKEHPAKGRAAASGGSSALSVHDGRESQSHNFILVLPRGSPPPLPPPPPVIGSQRAHCSPPPSATPSNRIPASPWEWQLPASLSPSLRAGLGCVPPSGRTPWVPAALLIRFHGEPLKAQEATVPPPAGVWGKGFRLPPLTLF